MCQAEDVLFWIWNTIDADVISFVYVRVCARMRVCVLVHLSVLVHLCLCV